MLLSINTSGVENVILSDILSYFDLNLIGFSQAFIISLVFVNIVSKYIKAFIGKEDLDFFKIFIGLLGFMVRPAKKDTQTPDCSI